MLQRLKTTDDHVKLDPFLQVTDGTLKHFAQDAKCLGCQAGAGAVQRTPQRLCRTAGRIQALRIGHLNPAEGEAGMVAAVGQAGRCQGHTRLLGLNHKQAEALVCVSLTQHTGHHDQRLGADAVHHKPFFAIQHPAAAVAARPGGDVTRVVAARLIERQRHTGLAIHHAGQPACPLRCVTGGQQQFATQRHRRQQRQGGQRAPHVLKNGAQPHVTYSQTTLVFRKNGCRPTQVHHLLPQRCVIAQRRTAIAQAALQAHGRLSGQEFAGTVGQLPLFIIQQKIHHVTFNCFVRNTGFNPAAPARAWQ